MVEQLNLNPVASKKPSGWGKRHTFALLGSVGHAISYSIRFNLAIAIVGMVNFSNHGRSVPNNVGSKFETACTLDTKQEIEHNANLSNTQSLPYSNVSAHNNVTLPLDPDSQGFNWSEETQGYILGAFFWGYLVTQIPAGILTHHFGGKWCFGLGIFISGVLECFTPMAANFGAEWIIVIRILQGLGGGSIMPATHGLMAKWIPPSETAILSPMIYAGMAFGSAAAMLVSGYITYYFGWAAVFYVTGFVSIIWFLIWTWLACESPASHPTISTEELNYIGTTKSDSETFETPWKEIWSSLPFWAILVGHFSQTWVLYTLMTEIPTYLKTVLNFDMTESSVLSAMPYMVSWVVSITTSFLGNLLLSKKFLSKGKVRKLANTLALWGCAFCLVGAAYSGCNRVLAVTFLTLAPGSLGAFGSGALCNHIDIAPRFASILMGITNTAATTSGFLAPLVVGQIIDGNSSIEQWRKVFLIAAGFGFTGNLFFVIFAKGYIQPWNSPKSALPEAIVHEEKILENGQTKPKNPA